MNIEESTPQFDGNINGTYKSLEYQEEDAYRFDKAQLHTTDQSFIDLNNNDVIYQSKKAFSPVMQAPFNAMAAHKADEAATRHRQSFGQPQRPHSQSADLSAVTATSSNSSANNPEKRPSKTQKVHVPIKVITPCADASQINFKDLLENKAATFQRDRILIKQIRKIFADGIRLEDKLEECCVRQKAYSLMLGLSLDFLRDHQVSLYHSLLEKSVARCTNHKSRMDEFRDTHGANVRLPLDDCCGDDTKMCRIIR